MEDKLRTSVIGEVAKTSTLLSQKSVCVTERIWGFLETDGKKTARSPFYRLEKERFACGRSHPQDQLQNIEDCYANSSLLGYIRDILI